MKDPRTALSSGLAGVLMTGVLLIWSPATWPVTVLQVGIFAVAIGTALLAMIDPADWHDSFPRTSLYLPLAFIGCWGPLQLFLGCTVYRSDTRYAALYWLTNITACLLAMLLLRDSRARNRFLAALLVFGFSLVAISILQSFTSPFKAFWLFESKYRMIGPFIYKNQFAAFVELIMPIALYRMLTDRKHSLLFAFFSATMFAAVLASASRAGTALLAVEVFAVLISGWAHGLVAKRIAAMLLLQVALLVGICTAVIGWEELGKHFQDRTTEGARIQLTKATLAIVRDYPLMGVGLGNWKAVYPAYALFDNGQYANAAHNDWAQWMAEGGVPFALALLWTAIAAGKAAARHPWGAGIVFVFVHSILDYPAREPVVGAILFSLLGALIAAPGGSGAARMYSFRRFTRNV